MAKTKKQDKQAQAKEKNAQANGSHSVEAQPEEAPDRPPEQQQNGQAGREEGVEARVTVPDQAIEMAFSFESYPADTFSHDDLGFSEDDVLEMYRSMLLQRRFEERCRQMYQKQKISGFLHLYIGQEAVSTGAIRAIRLGEDSVITAYRDHGMGLAMGMTPNECMAELFGKIDGCSRGKGGSMHFFDAEKGFFGGHAIVGAHVPLGVGIAYAHKYREEDNVCLCFFGDGAMQQGACHEAMNLAGLYDLPVVLICENNQYGMGTSVERASAEPDLFKRAAAYDMPGALVNGMDVFAVHKAVKEHVAMAREYQPSLLEIRTYRYQGHSISDPAKYRAEGELDSYKGQDPIIRLQKYLLEHDLSDEEALNEMDEEIKQQVLDAIDFAEKSAFPPEETIYEDIYVQEDYPFLTE